jgi:hypothetical protein
MPVDRLGPARGRCQRSAKLRAVSDQVASFWSRHGRARSNHLSPQIPGLIGRDEPHTRPGRRILLSVVILGLDPRISISVHRAELPRIPGATDARVKPEHDAESAIPIPCEGGP